MSWSKIARKRLARYLKHHLTNEEIMNAIVKHSRNNDWNTLIRRRIAKKIGREERRNK